MSTDGLTAKIRALHAALDLAGLPHAFGGALALAFCVAEPRTTKDIDLNVFVGVERLDEVVAALPRGVVVDDECRARLERDAQARAHWGATPVDLFLANHPFHLSVGANRRRVPFAGIELPVLACVDLAVFKASFARPKDAVDVATMVVAGAVDLTRLRETVENLIGGEERRRFFQRVEEFVAEA